MKKLKSKLIIVFLVSVLFGCKKNVINKTENLSFQDVAKELNFKLKNYDIVEKKLVNKFKSPLSWKNYILNFKNHSRNSLNRINSQYNLRVIDQYGSNHFFSQKISSDQTIKDFLEERGFYVEQCENAGAGPNCIGHIESGLVEQFDQTYLDDCQMDADIVLPCVAYCKSDCVINLDYDEYNNHSGQGCQYWDEEYNFSGGCKANDNLTSKAENFISLCRKQSITREFPDEFLQSTLSVIKAGSTKQHKKAWKLLNDKRFEK